MANPAAGVVAERAIAAPGRRRRSTSASASADSASPRTRRRTIRCNGSARRAAPASGSGCDSARWMQRQREGPHETARASVCAQRFASSATRQPMQRAPPVFVYRHIDQQERPALARKTTPRAPASPKHRCVFAGLGGQRDLESQRGVSPGGRSSGVAGAIDDERAGRLIEEVIAGRPAILRQTTFPRCG